MQRGHTLSDIISMIEPAQRRWLSSIHIEEGIVTLSYATGSPDFGTHSNRIDKWDIASEPDVTYQISMLQGHQYLGNLDAARFDYDHPDYPSRWIIKTHAGSDEERAQWLLSLQ